MSATRRVAFAAYALALTLAAPSSSRAQSDKLGQPRLLDSRANLEAALRAAESQKRTADAASIKARLTDGDFREGDRLLVAVQTEKPVLGWPVTATPDSLVVQPGHTVSFRYPNVPPLSLAGVLRSELNDRVRQHFAKVLTESFISRATALVQIGVTGSVIRQSYYLVAPDSRLSDLITASGGYGGDADPNKVVVHRGNLTVLDATQTRTALTAGTTIDQLNLRERDELTVGKKSTLSWLGIVQLGLGLVTLVVSLTR